MSWRQWQQQPKADEPVEVPKILAHLDHSGVSQSLFTGFLLSGVNPKNLLLIAAGAAAIDASMLATREQFIALLVFATIV